MNRPGERIGGIECASFDVANSSFDCRILGNVAQEHSQCSRYDAQANATSDPHMLQGVSSLYILRTAKTEGRIHGAPAMVVAVFILSHAYTPYCCKPAGTF